MSEIKLKKGKRYDLEDGHIGTCENCEKETWVRPVEAFSAIKLGRENQSRGFYNICFKCEGPHVLWTSKEYGAMRSPMMIPHDQLDDFLIDYFKNKPIVVGANVE